MSFRAVTAPWARSLSRTSLRRISAPRLAPRSLPRTPSRSPYLVRSIATSAADRATVSEGLKTEFSFADIPLETSKPQTLTEKIIQAHAVGLPEGKVVRSGDYVQIQPYKFMSHDNTAAILKKINSLGVAKIQDPKQLVFTVDHDVQNQTEAYAKKIETIEKFAKNHGIFFSGRGQGIGHQIMIEEGFAWPGKLCVASDSHSNMYGAVGALGVALVRTDGAAVWTTSKTWYNVAPTLKLNLRGTLPEGVTGKDVIVALCGIFGSDALNHSVEVAGSEETLSSIRVEDRMTISNMSTEWGALSLMFEPDETLRRWMKGKASEASMLGLPCAERFRHDRIDEFFENPLRADPRAQYSKELYLDLSTLSPYVSGPNSVKISTPLAELAAQKIPVNKCYIGSCTNSRSTDLRAAADVLRAAAKENGDVVPKFAEGVKLYLSAASMREQTVAEEAGDWGVLLEAGAIPLPAACNACIGMGTGLLEPGEVGVSASNRNFKGRMGSTDALCYLASPEVVAASALSGFISGPNKWQSPEDFTGVQYGYGNGAPATIDNELDNVLLQLESLIDRVEGSVGSEDATAEGENAAATKVLPGFPEKITGEILFLDEDNMNTDNIYAGKYTYNEDMTKEDMSKVVMENYDQEFVNIAKENDIIVGTYNFGSGSSREQAATAILSKGIPLVVAGSFSNIFARNSINNALVTLESPKLVTRLRETFSKDPSQKVKTQRTGWTVTWDVGRSCIVVKEGENGEEWEEKVSEIPDTVQEIIAKGGLEGYIKAQIGQEATA